MKAADIKLWPQGFLGAFAKLSDLELAKLVAQRLCRPRDVAVGFRLDGWLVNGARLAHELDDLIAAPSFRMDSGINHQAHGAEKFRREAAVVGNRVVVEANFLAELL